MSLNPAPCTCEEVEHMDRARGTTFREIVRMDLTCPFHFPHSTPYEPKDEK